MMWSLVICSPLTLLKLVKRYQRLEQMGRLHLVQMGSGQMAISVGIFHLAGMKKEHKVKQLNVVHSQSISRKTWQSLLMGVLVSVNSHIR